MNLHQQIDKDRDEERAREHMRANDVEAEVGEQHEGQTLGHGEAVGDLRVHLRVVVVGAVEVGEGGEAVQRQVQGEEEGVVDEEGEEEFEGEAGGGGLG